MPSKSDLRDWQYFWLLCVRSAFPTWNKAKALGSLVMLGLSIILVLLGPAGIVYSIQSSEAWPLLLVAPFAVNLLAIAPYRVWKRDAVRRDWLRLIRELNNLAAEGDGAMEAHGRPNADYSVSPGSLPSGIEPPRITRVSDMLRFMNDWGPRVVEILQDYPEYLSDFQSLGGSIYDARDKNDEKIPVSVAQLDVQLERLRGIISDIRARHVPGAGP